MCVFDEGFWSRVGRQPLALRRCTVSPPSISWVSASHVGMESAKGDLRTAF